MRALLLLGTDAGRETPWNRIKYAGPGAVARMFGTSPLPKVAKQVFGATTRARHPEIVQQWPTTFADLDVPSVFAKLGPLVRRDDLVARLPEIEVPALVLVGTDDISTPPSDPAAWPTRCRTQTLIEIDHAGHLSPVGQPEPVTDAMLAFLRPHTPACHDQD